MTELGGASVRCSFVVTVVDEEPPRFEDCPPSVEVTVPVAAPAPVSWVPPRAVDNVGLAPEGGLSASAVPGSSFSVGRTAVLYLARDAAGNVGSCRFEVTVTDLCAGVFCSDLPCVGSGTCFNGTCRDLVPVPAGTPCTDGNASTSFDACNEAGTCRGLSVDLSLSYGSYWALPPLAAVTTAPGLWSVEVEAELRPDTAQGLLLTAWDAGEGDALSVELVPGALVARVRLGGALGRVHTVGVNATIVPGQWLSMRLVLSAGGVVLELGPSRAELEVPLDPPTVGPGAAATVVGQRPDSMPSTAAFADFVPGRAGYRGCVGQVRVNGLLQSLESGLAGPGHSAHRDVLPCAQAREVRVARFRGAASWAVYSAAQLRATLGLDGAGRVLDPALIRLSLRFRTLKDTGVLLSAADGVQTFDLILFRGLLLFRFTAGPGTVTTVLAETGASLADGRWHNVSVLSSFGSGRLDVDEVIYFALGEGPGPQLGAHTELTLGGSPTLSVEGQQLASFDGCVEALVVQGHPLAVAEAAELSNIAECGDEAPFHYTHRAIPERACQAFAFNATAPAPVPAILASCRPPETPPAQDWIFENHGWYRCRVGDRLVTPCQRWTAV